MRILPFVVFAVLVLGLGGCQTATAPPSPPAVSEPESIAEIATEGAVWEYLERKYDRNGDGRIGHAEYDRGDVSFERLDRDQDGELTPDEFRKGDMMSPERMKLMMAHMVVNFHFQADDETMNLTNAELNESVGSYDRSGDELIDAQEFEAERERRGVALPGMLLRYMRDQSPFDVMLGAVDTDGDESLSRDELQEFFRGQDEDGDGEWNLIDPARQSRGGTASCPQEGEVAPDFTLAPPRVGLPVTLSSFRGKKPVALIFGSYT